MSRIFSVGDTAILDDIFRVRVVATFQDEDGSWWCEVAPVDFVAITREVPQERLEAN